MGLTIHEPDFTIAPAAEFLDLLGVATMPKRLLIVDVVAGADPRLKFRLPREPTKRETDAMAHIARIFARGEGWRADPKESFRFVFQASDQPVDLPSASWQRRASYQNVLLTPDFYYTSEDGYRYFYGDGVPDWQDREPKVFWRGATTGPFKVDRHSIAELPRYRLCVEALKLANSADVALNNIVQAQSSDEEGWLREQLQQSGLLREWVDMRHYAHFKMVVQIDGNANSWELIKKLRLGSCLLIVDSDWRLWHSSLIEPWVHYVPVRADLSDFVDKVHWCLDNDQEARRIASEGRAWALNRDYEAELGACADAIHDRFGPRR